MSEITIEHVQAKQAELAAMIAALTQPKSTLIQIQAAEIQLHPGEHYAGAVLGNDGKVRHHLVLMSPTPEESLTWDDAMSWASNVGGHLPDRQEQALLFANCKPHLKPEWHWSSEVHESNASYAWCCNFSNGNQSTDHSSAEGAAVAVRLIPLTA